MLPLVLLPGLLCDARLWRDQVTGLADIARPVVPDLGRDDTVDGMARRVLDETPGRFALAGLSMGGYVALAVMRLAPERVTRLCLMSTSARPDSPEATQRRRILTALVRNQPPDRFRGVTPRLLPQMLHPDRLTEPGLAEDVPAMAIRVGRDAYLRQQAAIIARPDSRLMPVGAAPAHPGAGRRCRPADAAGAGAENGPWCPAPGWWSWSAAVTCRRWSGRTWSTRRCGAGCRRTARRTDGERYSAGASRARRRPRDASRSSAR